MGGIEFLEPAGRPPRDHPAPGPAAPGTPARPHAAALWWVPALLWSVAAVLALLAAYQPVLRVSYPGSVGYTVDAWGRYGGGTAAESVLRGARYAPVLCALAAVCAVLAGYSVVRTARTVSAAVQTAATTVAVAAAAFLGGLVLTMDLQVTSALDSVNASVHWQTGIGDPVRGDVDTAVGSSVGFAAGALGCAVLAAAAGHPAVRRLLAGRHVTRSRPRDGPDPAG
jgi:hypothetical protein